MVYSVHIDAEFCVPRSGAEFTLGVTPEQAEKLIQRLEVAAIPSLTMQEMRTLHYNQIGYMTTDD